MGTPTTNRLVFDADAHIMEGPTWLSEHADKKVRDALVVMPLEKLGGKLAEWAKLAQSGSQPAEKIPELEKNVLGGAKGYEALGAFNARERSRVLDLTGIDGQLVFSTFSTSQFIGLRDPDLLYGGALAHNRAMAAWCGVDKRLLGVATVPLRYPDRAAKAARDAIELGCAAISFAPRPAGDLSPGHPDLDPFWRVLEETGTPFVLHIGVFNIKDAYFNNGRPPAVTFIGSGEGIKAKDFPNAHHMVEEFLTTICFDGVFERFPKLKGGVIEHGANWVPSFIDRLDFAARAWAKSTPELRELSRKPSEQFADQMRFTPLMHEDVAELVRQSNDRLYMFNTDYPHIEGTKDPFGRFEASVRKLPADSQARFYADNFVDLIGTKAQRLAAAA